jgi:hypothetical protein
VMMKWSDAEVSFACACNNFEKARAIEREKKM